MFHNLNIFSLELRLGLVILRMTHTNVEARLYYSCDISVSHKEWLKTQAD